MIKIPFARNDGYDPSFKCDNPIQQKWIHKQVVKKTGEGEDDFVIEEKAVLIDEVNIQKQIDEESKVTDLKYLLTQLLNQNGKDYKITGLEPELNKKPGFYGDITGVQSVVSGKSVMMTADQIKETLPEELKVLSSEQLAKMSDLDILKHINKVRASQSKVKSEPEEPKSDIETPKKEG